MAGKYKVLQMSKGDLTKERQEAKLHAELMAKDGIPKLQVTPPNHLGKLLYMVFGLQKHIGQHEIGFKEWRSR